MSWFGRKPKEPTAAERMLEEAQAREAKALQKRMHATRELLRKMGVSIPKATADMIDALSGIADSAVALGTDLGRKDEP